MQARPLLTHSTPFAQAAKRQFASTTTKRIAWASSALVGTPPLALLGLTGSVYLFYWLHLDDRRSFLASKLPHPVMSAIEDYVHMLESGGRLCRTMYTMFSLLAQYHGRVQLYKLQSHLMPSRLTEEQIKSKIMRFHERSARRLLRIFVRNGGVYIKFGQEIASCVGVLPSAYCQTMKVLYNRVPSYPFEKMESLFISELGKPVDELFEWFEREPVAAASLAQVHRARYKGRDVAVKLQYPSVRHYYRGDSLTRLLVIWFIKSLYPEYKDALKGTDAVREALDQELDFNQEAQNMTRARNNFARNRDVYVPEPLRAVSSGRILTMEYVEGMQITDTQAMHRAGFLVKDVARKLFQAFAEQTFIHGFLHADPHPANIFVRQSPYHSKPYPQIVLLDHGLYQDIPTDFRLKYCQFWRDLVLGNDAGIRRYCSELNIPNHRIYASLILMQNFDGVTGLGGFEGLMDDQRNQTQHMFDDPSAFLSSVSEEEMDAIKQNYSEWLDTFSHIPPTMYLVFRNMWLLYSINAYLGCPVNRFTISARAAVRGLTKARPRINYASLAHGQHPQTSAVFECYERSVDWLREFCAQAVFEVRLWVMGVASWLAGAALIRAILRRGIQAQHNNTLKNGMLKKKKSSGEAQEEKKGAAVSRSEGKRDGEKDSCSSKCSVKKALVVPDRQIKAGCLPPQAAVPAAAGLR